MASITPTPHKEWGLRSEIGLPVETSFVAWRVAGGASCVSAVGHRVARCESETFSPL